AEPDEDKAIRMMRGLTEMLEGHHKVRILDEAVEDAVKLSHRYITDRQLPDKCVSLLDTASARVALGQSATPPALEDCRREIEHVNVEIGILERERAAGAAHEPRLQELSERKRAAEGRLADLEKRWTEERRLVDEMQKLRLRLEAQATGPDKSDGQSRLRPEEEGRCRADLARLESELRQLQGE